MDLFEWVIKKRESCLLTASLIERTTTHWNEHLEDQITVFIELFPAIRINLRNWGAKRVETWTTFVLQSNFLAIERVQIVYPSLEWTAQMFTPFNSKHLWTVQNTL